MRCQRLHASAVAIGGQGVLLRAGSGAGKSSLALRLIDEGAILISDDQSLIESVHGRLRLSAPPFIAGRLEVRGLGIVDMAHETAPLALVVDLAPSDRIARLPDRHDLSDSILGHVVPRIRLDPVRADATARIRLALRLAASGRIDLPEDTLVSPAER